MWAFENENTCMSAHFLKVALKYTSLCRNSKLLDHQGTLGWSLGVHITQVHREYTLHKLTMDYISSRQNSGQLKLTMF